MRKRRAQGQQAATSGAFLWVVFYAFQSLFRRGLDNLSCLPADRAGKPCHGWTLTGLNA